MAQLRVERLGRFQVVAKRLLHHHAAPVRVALRHQAGGAELIDDAAKKARAHSQVKHHVVAHAVAGLELRQALAQGDIRRRGGKVQRHVDDGFEQAL